MRRYRESLVLGLSIGGVFGAWNLVTTRLDPLAEDTAAALLAFYGPMFALWCLAAFGAARRTGRVLEGVTVGVTVALGTFVVYDLLQFVRVNLFLDAISHRSDWQYVMASFQTSGFESLRGYANYVYLTGAPLKLLASLLLGAATGLLGGSLGYLASVGRR
jgi:hypothetical protein